jgi:putative transposase
MPNHFHLMVYVKEVEVELEIESDSLSSRETITGIARTFNDSIGLLLRSYTQAINKKENRTGSLFKPHCKAECITKPEGIAPSFFNTNNGALINVPMPEKEYPKICFNYIHLNPVKAGLTDKPEDWEFSSYRDYTGGRNGKLINRERTKEFELSTVSCCPVRNVFDGRIEEKDMLSGIRQSIDSQKITDSKY